MEYPINGGAEKLIEEKLNLSTNDLISKIRISYYRITLLNKNQSEKITFDINLTFEANSLIKTLNNTVIAESKTPKINDKTKFTQLIAENKIKQSNLSISKYCFGVRFLDFNVKSNNFKGQFLKINKIIPNSNI